MIKDIEIDSMLPENLFSKEIFYDVLEIEEPEEKARITAKMEVRAKELGIHAQFKKVLRAYSLANEELAKEYKSSAAKARCNISLDYDGTGRPLSSIDNFLQVLENDPKFAGLKFNLLTYSPEQERDGEMFKWLDSDDAEARRYIEKEYGFHSAQKCDDALRIVFAKHQYHPVRDLIDSFEWDGIDRISEFLTKWTKCDDTPYTREVSRLIFAGGIHRIYNSGCKFDDMPVLIGTRQGEGKSTLVRWLAMKDEYFSEVNEFEGQRGIESLEGAWICEVSELLAMTKTKEQEAVKSFLTRLNDRYRMPFDKRVTDHPRQCLFIGTTNKEQFLTDKTGNRRFYPVKVNQSGYDLFNQEAEIKDYIAQCWAEARMKLFTDFMKPYADYNLVDVIRQRQNDAVEDDYRVGLIRKYLKNKTLTCVIDIWQNALWSLESSKPTRKESNEIVLILQSLENWEKLDSVQRMAEYGVQRCWRRVREDNDDF